MDLPGENFEWLKRIIKYLKNVFRKLGFTDEYMEVQFCFFELYVECIVSMIPQEAAKKKAFRQKAAKFLYLLGNNNIKGGVKCKDFQRNQKIMLTCSLTILGQAVEKS